ncbi:hypothetical protein D9M71_806470 [compost metagenome]
MAARVAPRISHALQCEELLKRLGTGLDRSLLSCSGRGPGFAVVEEHIAIEAHVAYDIELRGWIDRTDANVARVAFDNDMHIPLSGIAGPAGLKA